MVCVSVSSLLLVLIPFFILCFFVHPSLIDDYCFVVKTNELGLANAFLDWYIHWTGRYSLCFLMSINPLLFGSFLFYRVITFGLIVLLPLLFFFLMKSISSKQSFRFNIGFTAVFTLFYFFQLPSVYEGLYWMTGAFAYQLPTLCLMAIFISLVEILVKERNTLWYTLLACVSSVVLIGANEISMATLVFFLFFLIAYRFFAKKKQSKELWLILLISILASLAVVLSPGNEQRTQLFPLAHDLPQAIKMTCLGFLYYVGQWAGLALMLTIIAFYILRTTNLSFIHHPISIPLWLSVSLLVSTLFIGFFIPAWATGQIPNPRAINVLFFIFLVGVFYHMIFVYQFLMLKDSMDEIGKITAKLVVFAVFFITFYPGKGINNNIKTAYVDLLSGKAYRFHLSMMQLYEKGLINDFSKELIPTSIGQEITRKEYAGCPQRYFKKYYK